MEKHETLEGLLDSVISPSEKESFSRLKDSEVLNLTSLLEKEDFLKFKSSVKIKSFMNEVQLNWKDFIYPALVAGGLIFSYAYSNHFINSIKIISQESKYLSVYYEEFLENYKLTFKPFMNFAGMLSLLYSSTFNSFTSIKYLNQAGDKKEKFFIGAMLGLSSLALGFSTYALFSSLFNKISLNLFRDELTNSLVNCTSKTISSSSLMLEKTYFLNTFNKLFKSFSIVLFGISPVLYPSLIPKFHNLYSKLTGKENLSASVLLLPSGKYSLSAGKSKLEDFLNHSLFFIEEKYIFHRKHSPSDLMKLAMSPLSKLSFYTFLRGYNFIGREEKLKELSDNYFWKIFSTSGAFVRGDDNLPKSSIYISSLVSEGKRRVKKYVDETNLPKKDKELLIKYLMPFYLSALNTDAPSKVLQSLLKREMNSFLNYAFNNGYLMPFKSRRNVELFHVKNPFSNSSFLEDIVVKLVEYERIEERNKLEYEVNSLSILNTRSWDLPWILKLKSLSDTPPLSPIPFLFSGKINLNNKNYYALITWMLKGKTLLKEINTLKENKFDLLSKTLRELVKGTARLNYNFLIKKGNLRKIRTFNLEDIIAEKIKSQSEMLSLYLQDSSLIIPPSTEEKLYTLMEEFNKLYSPHTFIVGDEDLNLENILIPEINCGRENCMPVVIDPILKFGPAPHLFYAYLADQRKGIGENKEVELVGEYIDLIMKYDLFKGDKSKLLTSTALLFAVRNLETEIMFIKYAANSEGEEKSFFLKSISHFSKYSPLFDELPSRIKPAAIDVQSYAKRLEEKALTILS